jgi:hypothetical protein
MFVIANAAVTGPIALVEFDTEPKVLAAVTLAIK